MSGGLLGTLASKGVILHKRVMPFTAHGMSLVVLDRRAGLAGWGMLDVDQKDITDS